VSIDGITEDDIAAYLVNTPAFFDRHAELLGTVQLGNPHGGRAVSLQERQIDMLRERIKGLERKIMEMIRNSQDNVMLNERLHRWTCEVLRAAGDDAKSAVLVEGLRDAFLVPQVALRVWGAGEAAPAALAREVSDDVKTFASSLTVPYCGLNSGFEAAQWLPDPATVQSIALVPLRLKEGGRCFGLLVLASPDALRYRADMGTELLEQIGEIVASALSAGLPAPASAEESAPESVWKPRAE